MSAVVIFKILTIFSSLALYLSPLRNVFRIHQTKQTGDMQLMPLVSMFCNYYTWMIYGFFIGDIFPLSSITCIGSILGCLYTIVFLCYTSDRPKAFRICALFFIFMLAIGVYAVLAATGTTQQTNADTGDLLGWFAVATTMVFYSAPLSKIHSVFRTKNSACIPVGMCVMASINNALWVVYAGLEHDKYLFVPNMICFCSGIGQVLLYFKYRPTPGTSIVNLEGLTIEIVISPKSGMEKMSAAGSPSFHIMASPLASIGLSAKHERSSQSYAEHSYAEHSLSALEATV